MMKQTQLKKNKQKKKKVLALNTLRSEERDWMQEIKQIPDDKLIRNRRKRKVGEEHK